MSVEERRSQKREILRVFVEDVGDGYAMGRILEAADARFGNVDESTWSELLRLGYVEARHSMGCPSYGISPSGWLKGIELRGDFEDETFRERCFTLIMALKKIVKADGRRIHHDAIVDERDLALGTGLPAGWIWNALKSGCLSTVVTDKQMDVYYDPRSGCFRVKPTFGMVIDKDPL